MFMESMVAAYALPSEHAWLRASLCAELMWMAQVPISAAQLEGVEEEARDAMLGERLYALICHVDGPRAGKITGMLLELEDGEILELLWPAEPLAGASAIVERVVEAQGVLAEFEQQQRQGPSEADGAAAASKEGEIPREEAMARTEAEEAAARRAGPKNDIEAAGAALQAEHVIDLACGEKHSMALTTGGARARTQSSS